EILYHDVCKQFDDENDDLDKFELLCERKKTIKECYPSIVDKYGTTTVFLQQLDLCIVEVKKHAKMLIDQGKSTEATNKIINELVLLKCPFALPIPPVKISAVKIVKRLQILDLHKPNISSGSSKVVDSVYVDQAGVERNVKVKLC